MRPPLSNGDEIDESREQLNLGAMIGIALAAVVGTTLTVWVFHFMQIGGQQRVSTGKPMARIAVLPFHSLSAATKDIEADRILTAVLIAGLERIARVDALPAETDADPVAVGRELGVKLMVIGKIERQASRVRVSVQLLSARDGRQVWTAGFDGDSHDLAGLSARLDKALAPYLTALLD